jgi:MshEN domain
VVEAGLVSADAVKNVLDSQEHADERLALVFVNSGLIDSAKLAQILSYQLCLPWVSLEHVRFSPKLLRMIPVDVAVKFGVVPVHVRRRATDGRVTLYIATDDPTHTEAVQACESASGLPVRMMVATSTDISTAIAEEYGEGEPPSTQQDDVLADTAPDGQKVGQVAPPAPQNGTPPAPSVPKPPPPPAPRATPDTDVAAAAARMSSPDLSAYTQTPAPSQPPPLVVSPAPPGAAMAASPAIGPSASSPPPPRVGAIPAERSPVPGLSAAATNVAPRIVTAPDPDDEDLEELDEFDQDDDTLPATRRIPAEPPVEHFAKHASGTKPSALQVTAAQRIDTPFGTPQVLHPGEDESTAAKPARNGEVNGTNEKSASDAQALFDVSSWEPPPPDVATDFAPPPPPPPSLTAASPVASAPPPPGAVPPPPPPPEVRRRSDAASAFDDDDDDVEVDLDLRDSTLPPEDLQQPEALSASEPPSHGPVLTPRSTPEESVLLLVGAEEDFANKCRRAVNNMSTRIVRCTLMTASARAKTLHPFVIVVPEEVYAFDRFAFNKLALEIDSPLLVWEREFEPAQVSALLAIAHRKMAKLGS